jgi:hypothetical protein
LTEMGVKEERWEHLLIKKLWSLIPMWTCKSRFFAR